MKKLFLFIGIVGLATFLHAEDAAPGAKKLFLEDCVKTGLSNFEPLKLADEEVELARLKRQEAFRGYFPVLSVKGEETTGETADPTRSPNFTERNYGAALSADVWDGLKTHATYRQAEASYQAAELSREKTRQDFLYSVRESYWNLVAAQVGITEREEVRTAIREDLKKVTEQYVLDLAVKQQFLAVKSQYLQANNAANAAKKNYAKAKWELAKALGLSNPPTDPVHSEVPFKRLEPSLEECLVLASTHRPDLKMQESLVDLADYGLKVARSAHQPRLSLNTFYGRSASAFEGDSLNYKEDWQVNAALTQRFLGSSVGLTGAAVHTSPKLGQSTRTETETKGANINILDGMKQRTEIKQADLAQRQAALKRNDLRKETAMDVENAFYGLNQALLQAEFSEEDLKLAEEELKVVESKGRYGITGILELAQARNRLAGSRASRIESLTQYQIAVAALNRAVGVPDKFIAE